MLKYIKLRNVETTQSRKYNFCRCFFKKDEDQYTDAISCLVTTVQKGFSINKSIKFEVFIHKVDGFPDEKKMEIYNEIQQRTHEQLVSQDSFETLIHKIYLKWVLKFWNLFFLFESLYFVFIFKKSFSYHLTSIYDHSIFEAFSKVVQQQIPQHRQLENLLDYLCNVGSFSPPLLTVWLREITKTSPQSIF